MQYMWASDERAILCAQLYIAGLPKVQNIRIRGNMVQFNHAGIVTVNQNITWDAPASHNNIQHYIIKYQMRGSSTINMTKTTDNATWTILKLIVPGETPISYSVQVAAVSEAGQGEFSDGVDFTYSSETSLPITGYNVTYTDLTTTVMSSVTEQMILIQHLSLGTAYKVVARAANVVGQGDEKCQPRPQRYSTAADQAVM